MPPTKLYTPELIRAMFTPEGEDMAELKRKTFELTLDQVDFIKRKKKELKASVGEHKAGAITESGIVRGLLDFWMAIEEPELASGQKKIDQNRGHKNLTA